MYIHIFTDDPYPEKLVSEFKEIIASSNITFAYNKRDDAYPNHIIDDFYALTQFDCLIRSCSNFSWAAQIIGNHKLIIYPLEEQWLDNTLIITKTRIIIREPHQKSLNVYSNNDSIITVLQRALNVK